MTKALERFIKIILVVCIAIFVLHFIFVQPTSFYDYFGCVSQTVTIALLVAVFYEKILWRINPLEKTPKLHKEYSGTLKYDHSFGKGEKQTSIFIKQSLLSVRVVLKTDEIRSSAITSDFVEEHGCTVLYYSYVTNPKAEYSLNNPIQYGTCRIVVEGIDVLDGVYWTSRGTRGDIYLQPIEEKGRAL